MGSQHVVLILDPTSDFAFVVIDPSGSNVEVFMWRWLPSPITRTVQDEPRTISFSLMVTSASGADNVATLLSRSAVSVSDLKAA